MPRPASAVAAIALAITLAALPACRREPTPPSGNVAARLTIPTRAAAAAFDPATLGGKPALVVFWRPRCPYCRQELPSAMRAATDRGVNAVAVQIAEDRALGSSVLADAGWKGIDLVDDGTLRTAFKVDQIPYTLVLRSDGTAARAFIGRQSYETLSSALASVR